MYTVSSERGPVCCLSRCQGKGQAPLSQCRLLASYFLSTNNIYWTIYYIGLLLLLDSYLLHHRRRNQSTGGTCPHPHPRQEHHKPAYPFNIMVQFNHFCDILITMQKWVVRVENFHKCGVPPHLLVSRASPKICSSYINMRI